MERRKLFITLGGIATHVCRRYAGDLFYDLDSMLKKFEWCDEIVILARTTGADLADRYKDCLIEEGNANPTMDDIIRKCESSLGWDVMVRIDTETGDVRSRWNDRGNKDFDKDDYRCFVEHVEGIIDETGK